MELQQEFLLEQQQRVNETLELIGNKTALNETEINRLKEISLAEKAHVTDIENSLNGFKEEFNTFQKNIDSLKTEHDILTSRVESVERKTAEINAEISLLRAELLALKNTQSKDAEKLAKLIRYQQLKDEKTKLENELKKFLGVPIERPPVQESLDKVLNIGLFSDITKED